MISIRLRPVGKRHQRSYRVVVDTKRHKLQGKNIEDLGWYNPHNDSFDLKNDRILHWIGAGAQPTDTVHNLLVKARVIKGKKIAVHSVSKKEPEEVTEEPKTDAPAAEGASEGEAPQADGAASEEVKAEEAAPVDASSEADTSEESEAVAEASNDVSDDASTSNEPEEKPAG